MTTPRIWITRSEPGASELAALLNSHGFATWVTPVIDIKAITPPRVEFDAEELTPGVAVRDFAPGLVIVLSAHAARAYIVSDYVQSKAPHIAVGCQTASVLQRQGLSVQVPHKHTSEGIQTLLKTQHLPAQLCVWLLAGEGGRDTLAHYLRDECHARVVKWAFYRRVNQHSLPNFTASQVSAVVIASVQGLHAFLGHWVALAGNMSVPVVVP